MITMRQTLSAPSASRSSPRCTRRALLARAPKACSGLAIHEQREYLETRRKASSAQSFGLTGSVLVFGFHGFLSERKFSIHKVPLETYMSKLWVYVLTAPSEAFLIQPATMWKTHTPTVLVDAAIVLSKRALPDEYRQLNPS